MSADGRAAMMGFPPGIQPSSATTGSGRRPRYGLTKGRGGHEWRKAKAIASSLMYSSPLPGGPAATFSSHRHHHPSHPRNHHGDSRERAAATSIAKARAQHKLQMENLQRHYDLRKEELARRIKTLTDEKAELLEQLEGGSGQVLKNRVEKDIALVASLQNRLDEALVENEQLHVQLLLKPDFYCHQALETLAGIRKLVDHMVERLSVPDGSGKKPVLSDFQRYQEMADEALERLAEIKASHRLRKHAHRVKESKADWCEVLAERHEALVVREREVEVRARDLVDDERRVLEHRNATDEQQRKNEAAAMRLRELGRAQVALEDKFKSYAASQLRELEATRREAREGSKMLAAEGETLWDSEFELRLRQAVDGETERIQEELRDTKAALEDTTRALSEHGLEVERKKVQLDSKHAELTKASERISELESHADTLRGHIDDHKEEIKKHEDDAAGRRAQEETQAAERAAEEEKARHAFEQVVRRRERDQDQILSASDMSAKFSHLPEEVRTWCWRARDKIFVSMQTD